MKATSKILLLVLGKGFLIRLPTLSIVSLMVVAALDLNSVFASSSNASQQLTVDPEITPPKEDPVLIGAGDIADCDSRGDEATSRLLDRIPGTVFTTGDNVYTYGTGAEFKNCYRPSWGRHKSRTKPSVGNHEYKTPRARGYFNYFGAAAGDPREGYYSYDLGEWHIIVLNSNCEYVGGCAANSRMLS